MQVQEAAAVVALTLVVAGILAVVVQSVLWVRAVRRSGDDAHSATIPWSVLGVALAVASTGFFLSRGLASGAWGSVSDLSGLLVTLAVACWGFGVVHGWTEHRVRRSLRATLLAGACAVTGVALGIAAPVLVI